MSEKSDTEEGREIEDADTGFDVDVEVRGRRQKVGTQESGESAADGMRASAEEMKRCAEETAEAVIGEIRRAFAKGKQDARGAVEESFDEVRKKVRTGIYRAAYAASYAASLGSSLIKDLVPEDAKAGASEGEGAAEGAYSSFKAKLEEALRSEARDEGRAEGGAEDGEDSAARETEEAVKASRAEDSEASSV